MLLNSLSILMGAVWVPSDYLWLYSTHIVLVCLYLLISKRLIVLVFTLLSVISVYFNEFNQDTFLLPLDVGQKLYLDMDEHSLIILQDTSALLAKHDGKKHRVSLRVVDPKGEMQLIDNVEISLVSRQPPHALSVEVTRVTLPDKSGSWWQRQLFIKRQFAQLDIKLSDPNDTAELFTSTPASIRGTLIGKLDERLAAFSSWRFSKALLLGENALWQQRDVWMIRTLGLAHLFVVSGLHVGFVFGLGCLLSRLIWSFLPRSLLLFGLSRSHLNAVSVIPVLVCYAYLTNWGEPVIRASIMLSVYLLARALAIKLSAYQVITFALWLVLLFDPRAILQPGLWLSFSMVYLLISFYQTSTHWSRLFMVQLMLSTASMVLVLGWQQAISSAAILVNLALIPIAAFIWFPLGVLACIEVLIIGTCYGYELLDFLLRYLLFCIEWLAFHVPLLFFATFSSVIPKLVMLLLLLYWVLQSPLKRGALAIGGIWLTVFFATSFRVVAPDLRLENQAGELRLVKDGEILLSSYWPVEQLETLNVSTYLKASQPVLALYTDKGRNWSPRNLLRHHVNWLFLKNKAEGQDVIMWQALQVDWLVLLPNESLEFYFQDGHILLRHSACIFSFFLFKSDTCKRVEKLESMLN